MKIIAAFNDMKIMGFDGRLPWNLPEDMAWFKQLTTGKTVVMGRGTWDSIGGKPLPNRVNIIVSSTLSKLNGSTMENPEHKGYSGTYVVPGIVEAIGIQSNIDDLFFIGGSAIYGEGLHYADTAYITHVKPGPHDCTYKLSRMWRHRLTYFPRMNFDGWESISEMDYPTHTSVVYRKIK